MGKTIKITKIDHVSQRKIRWDNAIEGKLFNLNNECNVKKRILDRFDKNIESRIYKEFVTNPQFLEKDIKDAAKNLCQLIKLLYLSDVGDKKATTDLIDAKNLEMLENAKKLKYKMWPDNYLYKDTEGNQSKTAKEYIQAIMQEAEMNTDKKIEELDSFQEARKAFQEYRNRKISILEKSIKNNAPSTSFKEGFMEEPNLEDCQKREQKIYSFLMNYMKDISQKSIVEVIGQDSLSNDIYKQIKNDIYETVENADGIKKTYWTKKYRRVNTIMESCLSQEEDKGIKWLHKEALTEYVKHNLHPNKMVRKKNGYDFLHSVFGKQDDNINKFKAEVEKIILNKITGAVIRYGKWAYCQEKKDVLGFSINQPLDSNELELFNCIDSFQQKQTVYVAFAASSYASLLKELPRKKTKQGEWILADPLECRLKNNNINLKRMAYFFQLDEIADKAKFLDECCLAIYDIRNSSTHFKLPEENDGKNLSIIKEYLLKMRGQAKNKVIEKFLSPQIQSFFTIEEMEKYFQVFTGYHLKRDTIVFAPSFQRVNKKGSALKQYHYNEERYDYFKYPEVDQARKNAKMFLLKQLYYHSFQTEFLAESNEYKTFKQAVISAKKRKIETKKGNSKKQGVAYTQIPNYTRDQFQNPNEYMAFLHQQESERLNKDAKEKKDKAHYVTEFIEDVFLEGFCTWLEGNTSLGFLKNEGNATSNNTLDDFKKWLEDKVIVKLDSDFNMNNKRAVAYFGMAMFLSDKHIAQLYNEITKLQARLNRLDTNKKRDYSDIQIVLELARLCKERLTNQTNHLEDEDAKNKSLIEKHYGDNKIATDYLKQFLPENYSGEPFQSFYFQSVQSDREIPIIWRHLEEIRKHSIDKIVQQIKQQITAEELAELVSYEQKNENGDSKIANLHLKQMQLHKQWVASKRNKDVVFSEDEYYSVVCEINRHQYLKTLATFRQAYLFHEINIDVLGRYVALMAKWERDFIFIMNGLKKLLEQQEGQSDRVKAINKVLDPEVGYFKIGDYQNIWKSTDQDIAKLHWNFMNPLFFHIDKKHYSEMKKIFNQRNAIAHLESLFTNQRHTASIIDVMNNFFDLFDYDKKMQNNIPRVLITILKRYGFELTLNMDKGTERTLRIKGIQSVKIQHLGGNFKRDKLYKYDEKTIIKLKEILKAKILLR